MSDFFKARFSATFTPTPRSFGGESPRQSGINQLDAAAAGQTAHLQELPLIRHGHLLAEPARQEWSLQTASYEYIAHTWAGDLPTGNARLTLAAQPLVRANTRASLERKLRHLELQLNLNRTGTLLLEEAFSQGAPSLHTYWHAVIETANATPLPLEEAPPIPGAWGKLELSIILTNPSQEPPQVAAQDNPGSQEDDPGSQEDNPGSQENPGSQYAIGHIIFANGRPNDDIGLYIGGQHITTNCGGGAKQGWVDAINAANCGVTAVGAEGHLYTVYLTATTPGEDGQLTLELRDNRYYDPESGRLIADFLSGPTLTLPS